MSEQRLFRTLQITFIAIIAGLLVASACLFASGQRLRRWYVAARQALWAHDYAAAAEHYERYLKQRPFDSDTWGDLALAYFHSGKYDQCIAAIRRYDSTGFSLDNEAETAEAVAMYRERLIRYVRAAQAGEDFGEDAPWFFTLYAPDDPVE